MAKLGKPRVIWGASIGPFSAKPRYERKAARWLADVPLIAARESLTTSYLHRIGVDKNVLSSADPAFHLEPRRVSLPQPLDRILEGECIGVNLSPLLRKYHNSLDAWTDHAAAVIDRIARRLALPVVLIPHVTPHRHGPYGDDYHFLRQVHKRASETGLYLIGDSYDAAETKYIISRCSLFMGARTHSTYAAISSCVPTLCVGYSMKAAGITHDTYGDDQWLIHGDSLDPDHVVDRLEGMWSRRSVLRDRLHGMVPVFKRRALDAGGALKRILVRQK